MLNNFSNQNDKMLRSNICDMPYHSRPITCVKSPHCSCRKALQGRLKTREPKTGHQTARVENARKCVSLMQKQNLV